MCAWIRCDRGGEEPISIFVACEDGELKNGCTMSGMYQGSGYVGVRYRSSGYILFPKNLKGYTKAVVSCRIVSAYSTLTISVAGQSRSTTGESKHDETISISPTTTFDRISFSSSGGTDDGVIYSVRFEP